ncbi:MAG: MFS transporter [Chloroflexia bacterium]|nr:MFS transporter [Chloroflexia bacterium]
MARATSVSGVASTRLLLTVLIAAILNSVLTASMLNVVLPVIRVDFGASPAAVGWVITGFALAYAIGIPLYGRLSDVFGVRRLFALGLLGFAVGGLICALAPSLPVLVAGRVVQGIGGAVVPALSTVSIAKVLPPGQRGGALGLIASGVGVGTGLGPIVGGVVEEAAGWHYLFYGTLVVALLLIPGVLRVLPDGGSGGERRFDLTGGVLLGLTAGLFLFGITQGQAAGFGAVSAWGSFLGSALAAAGFVWRITGTPDPFVAPALFRNRAYVAALIVGFCSMFAYLATLLTVPQLVSEVNALGPAAAGLVLTPGAVGLAAFSPWSGRLSDRVGVRIPILVGLTIFGGSVLFLSTFAGASPLVIALGVLGVGIGGALVTPATTNAAANALSEADVAVGLGIYQGAFFLGGGTGAAVIGAVLAARGEGNADSFNPLHTLGGAPFADAFVVIVLAVIVALVAALGLRGRRRDTSTGEQLGTSREG